MSVGVSVLGAQAWPDVTPQRWLVVALGATEQHGPHLPLSTDTDIAGALALRLVQQRPQQTVLGPALPFGASGEHQSFPGTLSIGSQALTHVLVELVRSAVLTFPGVVLVNGHGGNEDGLRDAVKRLQSEGRAVLAWSPTLAAGGDHHAGFTETSVMLAIAAPSVHLNRAAAGATKPLSALLPAMRVGGVGAVAPSGVLGDPTGANAGDGHSILDAWTASLVAAFDDTIRATTTPKSGPLPSHHQI